MIRKNTVTPISPWAKNRPGTVFWAPVNWSAWKTTTVSAAKARRPSMAGKRGLPVGGCTASGVFSGVNLAGPSGTGGSELAFRVDTALTVDTDVAPRRRSAEGEVRRDRSGRTGERSCLDIGTAFDSLYRESARWPLTNSEVAVNLVESGALVALA